MTQSQTHRDLYAVLEAIARLEKLSVGNSVDDVLIAQELGIDIQDVQDYLNILDEEGKVLLATSFTGCSAFLKLKGRLALKDPEYFLPEVKSGSGLTILGNVHTGGGDFVGRDYSPLSLESKRLQLHQEAYTLWRNLCKTLHDEDKTFDAVKECQDWWDQNCLYLLADASMAFKQAYVSASLRHDFLRQDNLQMREENWSRIEGAGDIIMAAVASINSGKSEIDNFPQREAHFRKVRSLMPELIAEMSTDLNQSPLIREFFLVSKKWVMNYGGGSYFTYFLEAHDNLRSKVQILENYEFVIDVTRGNTKKYRMMENFVEYLLLLQKS